MGGAWTSGKSASLIVNEDAFGLVEDALDNDPVADWQCVRVFMLHGNLPPNRLVNRAVGTDSW